jgi:hypothetical protein
MKNNKKWTEGLVWLCVLLAVSLTACGAAPDAAEGPFIGPSSAGPVPENQLNSTQESHAAGESGVGVVRSAVSVTKTYRLQPNADLEHDGWSSKPAGTAHWDVLNHRGDVGCAASSRSINTNGFIRLDDNTQLDATFIKKGAALTAGGTFWVCARQYTFVDSAQGEQPLPVATLTAVLRQRNAQGNEVRSAALGTALMQSMGPDNYSNSVPRWYAFSVPSGWTFSAGDTLVGGLRSADGRSRVQVYNYLVDVNASIPLTFP